MFEKLRNTLNMLLKPLIVTLTILMVLVVFMQVVFRYVLQSPLAWSEELARYLSIWITFLGAAAAIGARNHIKIDAFISMFPQKVRKFDELVIDLLQVVFAVTMLVAGGMMIPVVMGNLTPALQTSFGYVYASIPVSAVLMTLFLASNIYEDIMELRGVK